MLLEIRSIIGLRARSDGCGQGLLVLADLSVDDYRKHLHIVGHYRSCFGGTFGRYPLTLGAEVRPDRSLRSAPFISELLV